MKISSTYFTIGVSLFICFAANAQKLPNTQQANLFIANEPQIDGKATEWNNKFKAFNKNTDIFYTLSNSNDKLYLIVQVTDPLIIRKIISGGITFTVNTSGKKNNDGIVITYPVFEKGKKPYINLKDKPGNTKDTIFRNRQFDTLLYVANKRLATAKAIRIQNIAAHTDTLKSVYNEDNIKAAALFNNKLAYTYELSIPLKYLGILSKSAKINYNIRLNGSSEIDGMTIKPGKTTDVVTIAVGVGAPPIPTKGESAILVNPTDFWADYTLAEN